MANKEMEDGNRKVFILLSILLIMLIPLLKAKPEEELGAKIINTEYERINGLI